MKKLIFSIVCVSIIIITTIISTFAWFISYSQVDPEVTGFSAAAYFASGDGSKEKPYEITAPRHLYNLAWLQYLGKFNQTDSTGTNLNTQYYFKISKNIDMKDLAIPPIGTLKYPFVGFLNGNNHVISNLYVYNNISSVPFHPSVVTEINDCNIVGMFGVIGNYSSMYTTFPKTNVVENLYLNNVHISSSSKNSLAGLFSGYIATGATISSIGIHYSSLHFASATNPYTGFDSLSKYALIGNYNDDTINWEDRPGGGGMGFGGSLNLLSMYQRMKLINSNSWTTPLLNVPTKIDEGVHPESGYAMPLLVTNAINTSYYSSNTSEAISSNNIGYYTGNGAKIYSKKIQDNVKESDLTKVDGKITDVNVFTKTCSTSGEQYDLTANVSDEIKADVIDQLNYSDENGNRFYGIRLNSQVSQNNPAILSKITVAGQEYESESYLPSNAVWFVPQEDGLVKVVLAVAKDGKQGFTIYEINRSESTDSNPYHGSLNGVQEIATFYDDNNQVVYSNTYCREMTEGRIYYYEVPIKKGKEYAIGQANSNGSYLLYLDVGQNGAVDTSANTTINGIDFVYATSSSETGFSLLTKEYSSDVYFTIKGEGTTLLGYYFRRRHTEADSKVLYFDEAKDALVKITPNNANKVAIATDKNCTEEATTT